MCVPPGLERDGPTTTRLVVLPDADLPGAMLGPLRALMDAAFGGEFTDDDWDHTEGGWRAVLVDDDGPLAHAAVVPRELSLDGQRFATGYVEGVATRPDRQGQGLGSMVMAAAETLIRRHFTLGALSTGRPSFYERRGWERWRGTSGVVTAAGLVLTPDEDEGLLVLRAGPSARANLAGLITCEARRGDHW